MRCIKHTFIFESDAEDKITELVKAGINPSLFRDYNEFVVYYYV
jgi:hypothetical protein